MKKYYNEDIIKLIFDNKDRFVMSNSDILAFYKDKNFVLHVTKSVVLYGIFIYYHSEQIYKYIIHKNNDDYDLISNFYHKKMKELKNDENNEKLLVQFLGKNTRYHKLKKLKKLL